MKPLYIDNYLEFVEIPGPFRGSTYRLPSLRVPAILDFAMNELMALPWWERTEARKELFMSEPTRDYTYGSGTGARTYTSIPYIGAVRLFLDLLNSNGVAKYNACFLNRYDNQRNALGWHSDESEGNDDNHPIAVISFGVEREIWWRKKGDSGVVPLDNRQKLAHGSLFIMPAGFQQTHQHRIPKCDHEVGTRISLTFRRFL